MSERFIYNVNKNTIEQDGKFVAYVNSVDGFRIANKLTVLAEENKQLKTFLESLKEELSLADRDNTTLEKENEQLKQFKEDVFAKIDMHLRMLPTARDNEFNEDNGDPSLFVGAIYMLETLKKELEE